MAGKSNVPRKITAENVLHQIEALQKGLGIFLKANRGYVKSPKKDYTIEEVDTDVGAGSGRISTFENGKFAGTSSNAKLTPQQIDAYLKKVGIDVTQPSGKAVHDLILFLRDHGPSFKTLPQDYK